MPVRIGKRIANHIQIQLRPSFLPPELTESASDLDARGGGEETVPVLPAGHAGSLQDVEGVVVVEGVLAAGVGAVHGHALEAVDALA